MFKSMTIAAALTALLGFGVPAFAQANDAEGYGDGYQSGAYGRVRAADDGATILRADSEAGQSDRATVNSPLFPGDVLRTDDEQRVEVQLAGGSIVRVDSGSELLFQSLPNPEAKFQDNTVLALKNGVIRITSRLNEKEEFRIDTPDAAIYLNGEGEFRVSTGDRNGTRVESLRGVAEVVGNDASVLVRGGMGTLVASGSSPDTPRAYSALTSDGFDRWCASRDDAYRAHDRNVDPDERDDVPAEVSPYYGELSAQGRWDVDAQYGAVWYPTGVSTDWRPYYDGYWSYGPGGYFWVSNEPWGWAPYHYGCWQWTASHRWCWVPGHVFAGAWVSWSWGSLSVGWAPLDYWGRPGCVGGALYAGYYDAHSWTFVNYDHLHSRNVSRYAVPIDGLRDDLRHATVVARAPSVDPRRIARSPEWRDRALREVRGDRSAQMSPIATDRRPERTLSDVQDQLMRRPNRGSQMVRSLKSAGPAASVDPRTTAPRQRRILDDPRGNGPREARPQTRDDVRELYERMSRPKETREQQAPDVSRRPSPGREVPNVQPRRGDPRGQSRREAPEMQRPEPRSQPQPQPRFDAPRQQAPRQQAPQPQPRFDAPRQQAPRPQPRFDAPRQQAPRPQPRVDAPRQAPRSQPPRSQPQRSQPQRERAPQGRGQDQKNHGGRR
jgi:hypothetical protein